MSKWEIGGTRRWSARLLIRAAVLVAAFAAGFEATPSAIAQSSPPVASQGPVIPVSVGTVTRQDVPLWLHGLGTVQAFNSVQLRPKVDGTLLEVPVAEGQIVKQGDLLAVLDARPYQAVLDAAMAKKGQDQAQLSNAQADLARYASLARQDFASRQQLDTQQALVKQFTATIAGDVAQIEAAQLNVSYCYITAPFQGRVGLRTIDPGNFVRSAEATSLMPLSQIQPIAVTFTVPQDALPAVQDALKNGKPPVMALSGDDKTELDHGTLMTIDNTIDTATGTIRLKAAFPNQASHLWPGQFVNTRVLIGSSTNVLTVPLSAVMHGQDRLYAYVVKPDQTVTVRTVEMARDDGTVAIITSGLEQGQQVVTDGQARLQEGSHVTIIPGTPKQAANTMPIGG
jgi:multidrug efflux system membrane fusion protein